MKIELRKTKREDIKLLAEVYIKEFSKPPYNETWTLKKSIEKINVFKNLYDCYTIIYEKNIVGLVAVNPMFMCPGVVAFGEDMVIKEEFQRIGIGKFILNKIFEIYKRKGFKYFMGFVHKKSRALKIYKKMGFSIDKDFILIEKKLR